MNGKSYTIYKIIIIAILMFSINITYADIYGKISGKVVDKKTGQPLLGANVVVKGQRKGAATDVNGDFYILNVPPGEYRVSANYIGYAELVLTKIRIEVDKTTHVNFELSLQDIVGKTVEVTAYRPDKVERDITATRQTYAMDEMGERAGTEDISGILGFQADVSDSGNFRGGRLNETIYLIDGGSIVNPLDNSTAFAPLTIGMEQVQVITSGFSAEYGNAQSGVVNMVPKQGGAKWSSNFNFYYRPPHDPYFGGNIFDPNRTPYKLLINPDFWLTQDAQYPDKTYMANSGIGDSKYVNSSSTFQDSLKRAIYAANEFQSFTRLLGGNHNNVHKDVRFQFSTGGPITKNTRIFTAIGYLSTPIRIPTAEPDTRQDVMVNLTHLFRRSDKLIFGYDYNRRYQNSGGPNPKRLFFEEEKDAIKINRTNNYRMRWEHMFSSSAFMDINLRLLHTNNSSLVPIMVPGILSVNEGMPTGSAGYVPYFGKYNFNGFVSDLFGKNRGESETKTYTITGSLTNQITKNNLVKTGFQFYTYDIYNKDQRNINGTNYQINEYTRKPYEGAIYIQDKLEFDGFVANVGLRLDYYDFNSNFYTDLFSPTRNPFFNADTPYYAQESYLDMDKASRKKSKPFWKIQPRIGIAYPVSEATVIHINYGQFIQRPGFQYIYRRRINRWNLVEQLGNPKMEPEKTNSYDFGMVQALPGGFRLDLSAYYKDVKDLIQMAIYTDEQDNAYISYANRDYANIKGFHISLEKYGKNYNGVIRYRYQKATGKASTPFDAPVSYTELDRLSERVEVVAPDPQDIPMDYERTHRLIASVTAKTPKKFLFKILGNYPLSNLSLNIKHTFQSGRPYTYNPNEIGQRYNKRTPDENNMTIRLQKLLKIGPFNATLYFDCFNALNDKVVSYSVFKENSKIKIPYIEHGVDYAKYYNQEDRVYYNFNQIAQMYSNRPRYFQIGLKFKF